MSAPNSSNGPRVDFLYIGNKLMILPQQISSYRIEYCGVSLILDKAFVKIPLKHVRVSFSDTQ